MEFKTMRLKAYVYNFLIFILFVTLSIGMIENTSAQTVYQKQFSKILKNKIEESIKKQLRDEFKYPDSARYIFSKIYSSSIKDIRDGGVYYGNAIDVEINSKNSSGEYYKFLYNSDYRQIGTCIQSTCVIADQYKEDLRKLRKKSA